MLLLVSVGETKVPKMPPWSGPSWPLWPQPLRLSFVFTPLQPHWPSGKPGWALPQGLCTCCALYVQHSPPDIHLLLLSYFFAFLPEPPIFYHIIWLTLVCLLFTALSSPLQCKHHKGRNLVYFVHCCSIITELSLDHSGLTKDVCWMNPWKNERVSLECIGNRREHIRGQTGGGRGEKEEKQGEGGGVGRGEV